MHIYTTLHEANVVCCAVLSVNEIGLGCKRFMEGDTVYVYVLECAVTEEAV